MEVLDLEKINGLLNLINHEPDFDKICLYAKDPYKAKYQVLIKKHEDVGTKHLNYYKAFTECSNDMQDVSKNIGEYNPGKDSKMLIVFDDMIADMHDNRKFSSIATDLFIRCRRLTISPAFALQFYLKVWKDVRLNTTNYVIMKNPNKEEVEQIAYNHSSDIDLKTLWIFTKMHCKPYSFEVIYVTLASGNPLHFIKNLLERI